MLRIVPRYIEDDEPAAVRFADWDVQRVPDELFDADRRRPDDGHKTGHNAGVAG